MLEAGCDEAGRGCLAGPVFAAAVILPPRVRLPLLNDSKKLSSDVQIGKSNVLIVPNARFDRQKLDEIKIYYDLN